MRGPNSRIPLEVVVLYRVSIGLQESSSKLGIVAGGCMHFGCLLLGFTVLRCWLAIGLQRGLPPRSMLTCVFNVLTLDGGISQYLDASYHGNWST